MAVLGLVALTLLSILDKVGAEAVVAFLGGLMVKPEALDR